MENIKIQDNWYIKPLELPNVEKFVSDINNISFATTGFVHAWESNLFFDEACQLIINAIKLFQLGYFDCAFYSLRQSIETTRKSIFFNHCYRVWDNDTFQAGASIVFASCFISAICKLNGRKVTTVICKRTKTIKI